MQTAIFSYSADGLRRLREAKEGRRHPVARFVEVPVETYVGEPMTDQAATASLERFIADRHPKSGLTPLDFIRTY